MTTNPNRIKSARWNRNIAAITATATLSLLVTPLSVEAQQRLTQFSLQGPLESFRVAAPGNPLSPATMKVQGVTVTIPANLIVQLPATYMTSAQIIAANPEGSTNSGLAADDVPPPVAVMEANVVGNIVNGVYIAGLVYITQNSLAAGAGYIRAINATTGELTIGPHPADAPNPPVTSLARVRVNDPMGTFAPAATAGTVYDPRFTIDLANPTVHAASGFPMCVPVAPVNPNCFPGNRPIGANGLPLQIFVMDNVALDPGAAAGLPILPCPACDPTRMAPFVVGDFVNYAGKVQRDGPASTYISAYNISANVAIYTRPGTGPAYVLIEGSLIGTMGPPTPSDFTNPASTPVIIEAQDRFKVEGFLTDPSRVIDVYAIDKSAVGVETLRFLGATTPQAVPFGRFRLILDSRANALFDNLPGPTNTLKGAPREIIVALRIGGVPGPFDGVLLANAVATSPAVAGALKAGFYVAPLGEYIFPENHVAGEPIVPNNFECMPWLLFGSGPLDPTTAGSPNVGPLVPWPGLQNPNGTAAATSVACGPKPKLPRLGGGRQGPG